MRRTQQIMTQPSPLIPEGLEPSTPTTLCLLVHRDSAAHDAHPAQANLAPSPPPSKRRPRPACALARRTAVASGRCAGRELRRDEAEPGGRRGTAAVAPDRGPLLLSSSPGKMGEASFLPLTV